MTENKLSIQKTIRYYTIGDLEKANYLLIALHGYGQLPSYFGRKFENVPTDYFVVIPEGLHRFYLEGTSGRVGSSWMTKEAREDDIHDNINYLNLLLEHLSETKSFNKIILLGFSQGGATAARFYYTSKKISHLILWACVFPPDLKMEFTSPSNRNYFVVGNDDPYFKKDQLEETIKFYLNMNYEIIQFTGNHSIEPNVLNDLLNKLK
jgi:predicted esterase